MQEILRTFKKSRTRYHSQKKEKKVKIQINKLTAIQEHLLCCNYSPTVGDFSILTRESNDFKLKVMDSLLIAREKPSLPLEKF